MADEKVNDYQKHIENLNLRRNQVDEYYKTYAAIDVEKTNPRYTQTVGIGLQMVIYVADLFELLLLLSTAKPNTFSLRCTSRLAALRLLERSYSFGPVHGLLRKIANEVGIVGGDEAYRAAFKNLKVQRTAIDKLASIRHTAGHYSSNAIEFIGEIESVNAEAIRQHIGDISVIAAPLTSYVTHIVNQWPKDKLINADFFRC